MDKKILTFLAIIILFSPGFVLAAKDTEVTYPSIPGAITPDAETTLPAYLEYLYYAGIGITGIIALIIVIWGGMIHLTSAGDPNRMRSGKQKIIAGLSGIAIILGAHLTLNTINPQIIGKDPSEIELPDKGYCLRGSLVRWEEGTECSQGWEEQEENVCQELIGDAPGMAENENCCQAEDRIYCLNKNLPEIVPQGFFPTEICFREPISDILGVYLLPEKNYQGNTSSILNESLEIDEKDNWQELPNASDIKSMYFIRWEPGFHLFPSTYECNHDFTDYPANLPLYVRGPVASLGEYGGRTLSIGRWPDPSLLSSAEEAENPEEELGFSWGGIFFTQTDFQGGCRIIFSNSMGIAWDCFRMDHEVSSGQIPGGVGVDPETDAIYSAYTFRRNINELSEGKVTFFSGIDYSIGSPGKELPSHVVGASEIDAQNTANQIWTTNLAYDQEGTTNSWGQEHILSVKIDGKFLVILNSEPDFTGDCTIITQSTPSLFGSFVLRDYRHGARIKAIAIIPLL